MPLVRAKTWIEVSQVALANNIQALKKSLAPGVAFCAVIKANAYGHGTELVARVALKEGIRVFAVDTVDEAKIVRDMAKDVDIFILGYTIPERFTEVVEGSFIQTIYDPETLRALLDAAKGVGMQARVNLKIETGLNRQGMDKRELGAVYDVLKAGAAWVTVTAVATHFASSENIELPAVTTAQTDVFYDAIQWLAERGITPQYQHLACSAAGLTRLDTQGNLVRFGIALYGLWPSLAVRRAVILGKERIEIMPALSWKTRVAQVKDVAPGKAVSYGGTYVANRPIRVGVLPIGYADGYDRHLSSKGEVIIRGVRCAVLGRVCMNMIMVDVSAVPGIKAGEVVTLIGRDGMHTIGADDIAEKLGTINYEVVTRLNPLIPRVLV